MDEPIKIMQLKNGVLLRFYDHSNRYFGDYHRLCIRVHAEIPLSQVAIADDFRAECARLPEILQFEKSLQRMGVAGADIVSVRTAMIADFLDSTLSYLEAMIFPEQLLRRKLQEGAK